MKRTMLLMVLALFCTTLLVGCYRPFGAEPDRYSVSKHPKVYTLGWLRNDFYLMGAPIETHEQDGKPMKVSVTVRLREAAWESPIACQYRFVWLDAQGAPLDPDPTWQYRMVEPRVRTVLQGSAPDIGAVDWWCEIRQNRVDGKQR